MQRVLSVILFIIGTLATSQAEAIVVQHTDFTISRQGNSFYFVIPQAVADDYTVMFLSKTDVGVAHSILTPNRWAVDGEADLYITKPGDIFTADTISSGAFKPFFTLDQPYTIQVPLNSSFFLGVNTGPDYDPNYSGAFPNRQVFGWIEIRNVQHNLLVLRNAMAYGESGIVIGTTTPVPEPQTISLMILGIGLLRLATKRFKADHN